MNKTFKMRSSRVLNKIKNGEVALCTKMNNYVLRLFAFIVISISCFNFAFANEASNSKKLSCGLPYNGVFSFGKSKGYLQLPKNYNPNKKYPFILFFHGRGGSASINNFVSKDFANFRELSASQGFIVAVPGYGANCWLNARGEKITLEMIKFLETKLSIDKKHFYVMGCSMGGGAALVFTARHSKMVNAVCDIFGVTNFVKFYNKGFYNTSISRAFGGTPSQKLEIYRNCSAINYIDILKQKPVLIIHGAKDSCVPKWNSDEMSAALKKSGANVSYTVVPKMGHSNSIIKGIEQKVLDFFKKR